MSSRGRRGSGSPFSELNGVYVLHLLFEMGYPALELLFSIEQIVMHLTAIILSWGVRFNTREGDIRERGYTYCGIE